MQLTPALATCLSPASLLRGYLRAGNIFLPASLLKCDLSPVDRPLALRSICLPPPFLHPSPSGVLSNNPSSRLTDLWPRLAALWSRRRYHLALLLPQVHLHSGQLCAPPGPALMSFVVWIALTLQPPPPPTQDFLAAFPFFSAVSSRRSPPKVSREDVFAVISREEADTRPKEPLTGDKGNNHLH